MSNPAKNWRWWLLLLPSLAIILTTSVLLTVAVIGEISMRLVEVMHQHALRPMVRWTWGDGKRRK